MRVGPFFVLFTVVSHIPESTSGLVVKNLPAMQETCVCSLGQEDSLQEEMATHSTLPRKFHGQRSLADYSPWDLKQSDTTESERQQMTTPPIRLSPLHIISQSVVKWTNEWRTGTGHRKVMQLSLLFNSAHGPPFEPVTSHFSYFVSKLSSPDSGSQAGWGGPGSTWGCPLPRAMNPPPAGSRSENLCHHPAGTTSSALDSDSGQRSSFPPRTACAFSEARCFSTMFCSPRHTCTLSEPPTPSHPSLWHRKTRILRNLFCSPPSVPPEWVMS